MTGNAKDVCVAEAKGREDVAGATEADYKPTAAHTRDLRSAAAKAIHAVAKADTSRQCEGCLREGS